MKQFFRFLGFHESQPRLFADAVLIVTGLLVEGFLLAKWGTDYFGAQSADAAKGNLGTHTAQTIQMQFNVAKYAFWCCIGGVIIHHFCIFRNFRIGEAKEFENKKAMEQIKAICNPSTGVCFLVKNQMLATTHGKMETLIEFMIFLIFGIVNGELPYLFIITGVVEQRGDLLKAKSQLEELLRDAGHRVEQWVNLSERVFEFACIARSRFATGDAKMKKEILSAIGSNLTLKDNILSIEARKPFFILEKSLPDENHETEPIEPENMGLPQGQKVPNASSSPALCPW
ncbi:MAG: hypothetical protein V4699_03335 [Patescibacteria group bacterium]